MTFTHARPLRSEGLTDEQRESLTHLEQVGVPTGYARGALVALRLCATDEADRSRVVALAQKWGPA